MYTHGNCDRDSDDDDADDDDDGDGDGDGDDDDGDGDGDDDGDGDGDDDDDAADDDDDGDGDGDGDDDDGDGDDDDGDGDGDGDDDDWWMMMMIDDWWWMMDDDDEDDDDDGDGDGDDDGDDDDGDGDGDGDDDDDDDDDGDGDGDDDDDHQQSNLRLSPIFRQTRIGQGSIPNKTEHLMIPPFVIHSHPNIFWRFRQHFWDVHKGIWVKWLMPIFLGELVHPPIVHHGSRPQVFVPFYCRLQACKQDRLDQELLVVWPQMSRRRSGKSGKKSWLSRGFYMVPCKMEIEQTKMRTSPTKMVIQFILYAVLCGYIRTISSLT